MTSVVSHILNIQKNIRLWNKKLATLPAIKYSKDTTITYTNINVFTDKKKCDNDKNNKLREDIVGCIINNKLPCEYYKYSSRWNSLKNEIYAYINNLCKMNNIERCEHVICEHKAGRTYNYDFLLKINKTKEFHIEFKFNATCVNETPQFVSPMKPSQYLDSSYEEYYYENYLVPLLKKYVMVIPERDVYLKEIHSPSPECVKDFQEKYYNGCKTSSKYTGLTEDIKFYQNVKQVSKDSITSFISKYGLNKDKLSEYLLKTQKEKCYMLYKDGHIHYQTICSDNYIITKYKKDEKYSRYIAKTKTGIKLKILLRWKNGNGIAYPSFQIS